MMQGGMPEQMHGSVTEEIFVPDNMVGLLIGRGGENITRMQQEASCKIQMSQDNQGGTVTAVDTDTSVKP